MTTATGSSTSSTANSSANTPATSASTVASQEQFAGNMNTFLTMLTTQLSHQDPLSPMDSSAFTNQLVLFSQVEQQIDQNQKLDQIISLTQANQTSQALSYVGYQVEAQSSTFPLQDGTSEFSYQLPSAAKSTEITISDSSGTVVDTMAGEVTAGAHSMTWDGKDSNGNQLADGNYTVAVNALDSSGNQLSTATTAFGKVTGVTSLNGETTLIIGGVNGVGGLGVPLSSVLSVTPPSATSSTSTGTTGTGTGTGSGTGTGTST